MTPRPTTRLRRPALRPVLAVLLTLAGGPAAVARSPAEPLVAPLRGQVIDQQCGKEAGEWEVREYRKRLPNRFQGARPTAGQVVDSVELDLNESYPPTRVAVLPPADRLETERKKVSQRWDEVMSERAKFQQAVEAGQQADGFNWSTRSVPPIQSETLDYTLLGVGAAAVAVGLWGTARRVLVPWRARRARAMRSAAALLALTALAASGCRPNPTERPWADAQWEELTARPRTATAEADGVAAEADAARRDASAEYRVAKGKLVALRDVLAATLAVERMKAEEADQKVALDADTLRLEELSRTAKGQKRTWVAVRVGVGLLVLTVALAPFQAAVGWGWARRKADADTCPRCLATVTMMERRAVIECGGCGFRYPLHSKGIARLCFPTVGIRSSGKTHLLVTAYASVKNRNTRSPAPVQQAASMGDEQFNTYIDLVLKPRGTIGATVQDLPASIVVCARDTDRGGPSTVLVNLFDYSGEMRTQAIAVDDLRRRAVRMDGFLMFFDPTQMYGDVVDGEATLALEDQLAALHQVYQDMMDARGLTPGRPVPVPVAVCVSRFDLVATRSPMGGQALPFLTRPATELDPPGSRITRRVLRERSRVVEQMPPFMLPGADRRKILRDYFGDQFLFFPTSDRGLAAPAGGRAQSTYGMVEPLPWLLPMHGYRVLKGD